ncbi:hypothetical protein BDV24DRAFT_134619 [Aspergillus arachidicola]|uniref:Uncharacterized protein n=1 Tax=Aspergillus arachidicola TaxID=656916 RepID=A0A5N6Y3P4_9EURO|nr:hypothetical protein BDV24DRAFT_134619 [Aspergillus arachidicola]
MILSAYLSRNAQGETILTVPIDNHWNSGWEAPRIHLVHARKRRPTPEKLLLTNAPLPLLLSAFLLFPPEGFTFSPVR